MATMILFLLAVIFFVQVISVVETVPQRLKDFELSDPDDVGVAHTEAFAILADMYFVERPVDREKLMSDAGRIAAAFCDDDDDDGVCSRRAREANEERFRSGPSRSISWPDDFGPSLLELASKANEIVASSNGRDIDDVVSELYDVKREVEDLTDDDVSNEGHRIIVLCGLSVAIESTRLWREVYGDPDHVLYGLHDPSYYHRRDDERRSLRRNYDNETEVYYGDESPFNVAAIVAADSIGGIEAALEAFLEGSVDSLPNMVGKVVMASFSASAAVMVVEEVNGDDNDDDIAIFEYDDEDDDDVPCEFEVPFMCT